MMKWLGIMLLLFIGVQGVSAQEKKKSKNKKTDNYTLESNFYGDKEQPAVSYFVPWQGIGTPDKLQWDIDSKYDNTLNLVDRDVMLRSTNIYNEMKLEQEIVFSKEK